jgi:hypothetical protein
MKSIYVIITGLLFASSVFAQNGKPLLGKSHSMSEEDRAYGRLHWTQQSSGYLLQQASLDLICSGACGFSAGCLAVGSAYIDNPEERTILLVSSGVLAAVATYFSFKGVVNIGRAGKVSDRKEFPVAQLRPSKEGIGFNLTF